jgi:GT2 family glycosyltransferase
MWHRERVTPRRPPIAEVPAGEPRPRWSVMVPTYHCAAYLEQTLTSVLAQDPGPEHMEIVVVDDHSVLDDPEEVVRDVGGGRVRFVRQERNVGHVRTFNAALSLARGEWVHLLHGDDWVEHGFYAAADRAREVRPDLAAFVCRYRFYVERTGRTVSGPLLQDHAGALPDWLEVLAKGQRIQAPSTAVRRSVYEDVGGFDLGIAGYGEDWEMWLRVAAAGPVWWEPAPLAVYRLREGSLSDPSRLRANMADMRRVHALNARTLAGRLTADTIAECQRASRRSLALALLRRARRALADGDRRPPTRSVVEALRWWPRPVVVKGVAVLVVRWAVALVRAPVGRAVHSGGGGAADRPAAAQPPRGVPATDDGARAGADER